MTVSEGTANLIYTIANVVLVIGAAAGLAGGVAAFFAGQIRDEYTEKRTLDNEGQIAQAHLEIKKRESENLELARQIEADKRERWALEAAAAPRAVEQGKSMFALKEFAGTEFSFAVLQGSDTESVAGQLLFLLNEARWKQLPLSPPIPRPSPGIVIEFGKDAGPAGRALRDQLMTNSKIEALISPTGDPLSDNAVRITVGVNDPYIFRRRRQLDRIERAKENPAVLKLEQDALERLDAQHRIDFPDDPAR